MTQHKMQPRIIDNYTIRGESWRLSEHVVEPSREYVEGIKTYDMVFMLPLDYAQPEEAQIQVFARRSIPLSKAKTLETQDALPYSTYPLIRGDATPDSHLAMRIKCSIFKV